MGILGNIDGKTQLKAIDRNGNAGYITLDQIEDELGLTELRERVAALEPKPKKKLARAAKRAKKKGGRKK